MNWGINPVNAFRQNAQPSRARSDATLKPLLMPPSANQYDKELE